MSTNPKRWPNHAEWTRADSIARLDKEIASLVEVVDHDLTPIEVMKHLAKTIDGLRQVQGWLKDVGK